MATLRRKLHVYLDTNAWTGEGLSPLNKAITVCILGSIVVVVIETETSIHDPLAEVFLVIDLVFATIFLLEYLARLWVMGEDPRYQGLLGRLHYAMTPIALIDLLAIVPFSSALAAPIHSCCERCACSEFSHSPNSASSPMH